MIGVGFVGAGPVVQAIHLPTLARLTGHFAVRHVMDVNPEVAAATAARVGAACSTTVEELLADEAVEVVAVCSPSKFHAEHVIAALRAGKRLVLCEKPFAENREQAEEIARISVETGVPVLVGAMHTFDPGWTEVAKAWGDLPETAHTIRSSIVLPPNTRYEDLATEVRGRVPMTPPPGPLTPEQRAAAIRGGVLGLAIHDLPLIRVFLPDFRQVRVHSAERLEPFGYAMTFSAGDREVLLGATMHRHWKPRWELDVIADDQTLQLAFTPSYVHAGSAVATLTAADGTARVFGPYGHNGYEGEWRTLYRVATGEAAPDLVPLPTLVDDLSFAVDLADRAANIVLGEEAAA